METSKHFKLYKSGKKWCVMALATVAVTLGLTGVANADDASSTTASSDEVSAQTSADTVSSNANESSVTLSNNNQSANEIIGDNNSSQQTTLSQNDQSVNNTLVTSQVEQSQNKNSLDTSLVAVIPQATSNVKNGWVKEEQGWTYYNNGVTNTGRAYSYLPTITANGTGNGNNWYLTENGVVLSGVQKWANTYYDFDSNTYLRVDNNYVKSQWGDWYLFGNDGTIQTKVQKWAGTYYYFDPITYLRVDNDYRQSQWGDWYLFGNDGKIQSGVQKWAGTYYYFDPTTYLRVDNDYLQSQWGDWYLFGNDGRILSGLQKWAGNYYYFDPVTYLKVTNKNITVGGISLHADSTGIISGVNKNATFLLSIHDAALDGWRQYGVLPSVTAAQAILESAWGQSALATQGHNLFGIKGSYNGQSITMRTAEYGAGGYYYINDAFRKYPSNYESVVDHGRFLATNSRYRNLLWKKDYAVVTQYLHDDGYATDPKYASSLNNVIRTYNLDAWDREVL